jgi:hypothetical protein
LEGLAMADVDIFYDYSHYFTAIWYILLSFGIFYGYLVYFSPFWYAVPRKIWQPWPEDVFSLSQLRQIRSFSSTFIASKELVLPDI